MSPDVESRKKNIIHHTALATEDDDDNENDNEILGAPIQIVTADVLRSRLEAIELRERKKREFERGKQEVCRV
jgi:hypothetical protein